MLVEKHGYEYKKRIWVDEVFVRKEPCSGGVRARMVAGGSGVPGSGAAGGAPVPVKVEEKAKVSDEAKKVE